MNWLPSGTGALRRAALGAALALTSSLWGLGSADASPSVLRTDNRAAVPARDIERTLSQAGLLATLARGDRLELFDAAIEAGSDSKVFLALSSEYLAAACLTGRISAGGETAEAGEVIIWHAGSQQVEVATFDVEQFLATTLLADDPNIRAALEAVAAKQRSQKFWGVLRADRRNVRAPVVPTLEEVRRSYLLEPEVVKVRREAGGDSDKLARLVAEYFLASLAKKEAEPVEALISPLLFQDEDRAFSRESWQELRGRFAKTLVGGGLPDKLAGFQLQDTADRTTLLVSARKVVYQLDLVEIDGMLFVQGLEPQSQAKTLN